MRRRAARTRNHLLPIGSLKREEEIAAAPFRGESPHTGDSPDQTLLPPTTMEERRAVDEDAAVAVAWPEGEEEMESEFPLEQAECVEETGLRASSAFATTTHPGTADAGDSADDSSSDGFSPLSPDSGLGHEGTQEASMSCPKYILLLGFYC